MLANHAAPLGLALLGLLLGMRHATDPDHVVAVTTILSRERRLRTAAQIGAIWGLGHTATMIAVGAAIIVFKLAIPVRIGLGMEFAVALMLILLGASSVRVLIRGALIRSGILSAAPAPELLVHSHPHSHGAIVHRHPHAHSHTDAVAVEAHDHMRAAGPLGDFAARRPLLRSFCVGLVHGLAGSAAIALLVLSAIPAPLWATLYLVVFCAGTILGMILITTAVAAPLMVASRRMARVHQGLVIGSGLLSFGFGLFMALQIGVGGHLFGSTPVWTPH
jgi:ABC-type nickel/cobalt efflux system permease component RcnA